LLLKVWVCLSL